MTNPAFNPEDPRLTAFVLGEINDSDRAEIEQLLEASPEAQAAVKEIEETIGVLREGLATEPTPELTAEQRATVEEQLDQAATVAPAESDDLIFRRRGVRLEVLMGGLISVAALCTFVLLPQISSVRENAPASRDANDEQSSPLIAMNDLGMTEESALALSTESEVVDSDEVRRQLVPADEFAARNSVSNESLSQSNVSGFQVASKVTPMQRSGNSGEAGGLPFGRSEADFAKNDGASAALAELTEKPGESNRGKGSKDTSRPGPVPRLIADSGARPRSGSGLKSLDTVGGGLGGGAPLGQSVSAPKAESRLSAKNAPAATDPVEGDAVPATGKSVQDKSALSKQLAGSAGGRKVDGPRPASAAPVASQPVSAPAPADSPEPARGSTVRPVRQPAPKNVLFLDEERALAEKKKMSLQRQDLSESEVSRRVRERAEGLAREAKSEGLEESKSRAVSGLELAAIDSGTRRAGQRGLGLPGRDLKEQLDQYYDRLSVVRSNLEKMPEARQKAFGFGNEAYDPIVENDFIVPVLGDKEKSLSTISVDVDTASYANMRRFLNRDQLPPADSVRIEELVNYFKYDYPEPEGNEPFSVKTELTSCPWQPTHRLAMVGLKAKTIEKTKRPPTNLIFLLDVSGSMRSSNKLPLVQQSMRLLVEEMTEDDRISIVTYASNAGVKLESTLGSKKEEILNAINALRAGGSTNGEGGIQMAYDQANRYYFQGGANRVILCSDGDFNVGKSSDSELVELIQEKAASGVFLSVFGFGMGNLKDAKLEKLADKGNGHYGYIDNLNEARKVFQDELVGTLYTVAKDVKLQVEFNPATVGAYRLIGYENRKLAAADFTDDTKDAGEIGSGHTVTALYEIIPKQILLEQPRVDGLKYQSSAKKDAPAAPPVPEETDDASNEIFTVKLRYKNPDEEASNAFSKEYPVADMAKTDPSLAGSSDDMVFAAAVASFGMNLRGSKYRGSWGFAEVLENAQGVQDGNDQAQRTEFVQLVQRAMRITGQQIGPRPRTNQGATTRPGELDTTAARVKASVDGKYRRLVKKIEVRDDFQRFGAFNDYGHWDGSEYSGHKDLPPGHWVYVYPNWYIWAEAVVPPAEDKPESTQ